MKKSSLTTEQIKYIFKERSKEPPKTFKALAKELGVTSARVQRIIYYTTDPSITPVPIKYFYEAYKGMEADAREEIMVSFPDYGHVSFRKAFNEMNYNSRLGEKIRKHFHLF